MLWSVIPAAFIGPGTVTTCSKAGAGFGLSLIWALTFSTLATLILQEAAARITVASGKSLGEIIGLKYRGGSAEILKKILFVAVAFGCAAYQTGNILGAVSGLMLLSDIPQYVFVLALGAVATGLLWFGNIKTIAHILAAVVFFMGLAFIVVAFQTDASAPEIVQHSIVPSIPDQSALIIIGLVGTTVVPYNLFLASGLSKGQDIGEMRWGIALAVLIGGLISIAILLTGTQISGDFSFKALSNALSSGLGTWAGSLFGLGLFAAGASSAVTAPLAAAITGQTIFGGGGNEWSSKSWRFRTVWGIVLLTGMAFGLSNVKPVPAIIAAQAVNGILLPVVAVFLFLAVNDKKLLPQRFVNNFWWNAVMLVVVTIVTALGLYHLWGALSR